jgi:hypothetical protein
MRQKPFFAAACAAAVSATLGGGCPDDDGTGGEGPLPCDAGFLGDESADPVLEAFFWGEDDADHAVTEGAVLDLIEPPQGGKVAFIGVRARNVFACRALLSGTLRDPTNNQVRFDTRTVNLDPEADGQGRVAVGDLSLYANVPICQNSWSDQTVYDGDYSLEVKLTDEQGRVAEATYPVRLRCTEKSQARESGPEVLEECLCICREDYMLGDTCEGGAGGGS